MRVLLVNDHPPGPGSGAEVYLDRLAGGLRAAGDEVGVYAGQVAHRGPGKVLDLWDPWARRGLAAAASSFRPDVVHHHNVLRELSVAVLGVPVGVPTVLTVHDHRLLGRPDPGTPGRLRRGVDRHLKRRLDVAVARRRVDLAVGVSPAIADGLRAAGFRRVERLDPPAPPPAVPPRPVAACHDVVYLGRITRDKGVFDLLDAYLNVAGAHPRSRLLLAGDGPQAAELATHAASAPAGVRERIRLLGRLDYEAASELLGRARVVVVPSRPDHRPEGAPLVVAEAAAHARPVVASDDPALVAALGASGGGVTVPAGSPPALAAALDRLLGDAAAAQRLGDAAGEAAGRYDLDAFVARTRALYVGLADGG